MKKQIKKILSMLFMFVMFLCTVAGCGDKEVTNLKVKEGTLVYVYKEDTPYSFDDLKLIVTYNDGTTAEVGKDDITISEFNTDNVGSYKVTFTYEGKELSVTLKVTNNDDELYGIYGVNSPESIALREEAIKEQDNEEVEFMVRDDVYVVGDDNPFTFLPRITALDDNDNPIKITSFKSVATLYKKNTTSNEFELVDVADYTEVNGIDDVNQTYDFTSSAIGDTFKLVVRPYWLTEEQLLDIEEYIAELEFVVVDGYNVHDEKELVVMTNYTDDEDHQTVQDAIDFLNDNGITNNINAPLDINGIVLHNDMNITKDDLPEEYFDSTTGKLGDYINLYSHKVDSGETFTLYGNYFTMNVETLPEVKVGTTEDEDGNIIELTSHSSVFRFISDENLTAAQVADTKSIIKNVAFYGNANRTDDSTKTKGTKGLILAKNSYHTSNYENCLMRAFFLHLFVEEQPSYLNINKVKSYDSYQNALFVWGGIVDIKESVFKRAGGPLMILQHPHIDSDDPKYETTLSLYAPHVAVDNKSVLESYVTGKEPWFDSMGATSTATQLVALAQKFVGTGKVYVKNDELKNNQGQYVPAMNLIAVNMATGESFNEVTKNSALAEGTVTIAGNNVINKNANGIKETLKPVVIEKFNIEEKVKQGMIASGVLDPYDITTVEQLSGIIASGKKEYEPIITTFNNLVDEQAASAIDLLMGQVPVFQSSNQGFGFLYAEGDNASLTTANLLKDAKLTAKDENNDYLGMYFMGLGITIGYLDEVSAE